VSGVGSLADELRRLNDEQLQASLDQMKQRASVAADDPYATLSAGGRHAGLGFPSVETLGPRQLSGDSGQS